jgi:hypothetical protein
MSGEQAANIFNILVAEVIKRIRAALNSPGAKTIGNLAPFEKILDPDIIYDPNSVMRAFGYGGGVNQGYIMHAKTMIDGVATSKPERAVQLILQRCEGLKEFSRSRNGEWPRGVEPYTKVKRPSEMSGGKQPQNTQPSSGETAVDDGSFEHEQNNTIWLDIEVISMASAVLYMLYRIYYMEESGTGGYR